MDDYLLEYRGRYEDGVFGSKIKYENHDFNNLRGYYEYTVDKRSEGTDTCALTIDEILNKLNFTNFKDCLKRIVLILYNEKVLFGCGPCCRTKLPEFIILAEKRINKTFGDIINELIYEGNIEKNKIKTLFITLDHYFLLSGYTKIQHHLDYYIKLKNQLLTIEEKKQIEDYWVSEYFHQIKLDKEKVQKKEIKPIQMDILLEEKIKIFVNKKYSIINCFPKRLNEKQQKEFIEIFKNLDDNSKKYIFDKFNSSKRYPFFYRFSNRELRKYI